ncbi:uncharacterized protein LOC114519267 isoform X2 [Dendronephthya gigantea]|uniref:uncharacterized protein LOC114519267 isoform X2 n=1 Tax=Dendronephthya gigantea TaxID=151771 RepID=UPI00106951BA|nr:uncharacterized protein LOC114519267 isoform X2 [Dendronephthya gigantea]
MANPRSWLGLYLLASCLGVIASQACPKGWKGYGNSCYLFVIPTLQLRQMSWEDSRANCLGYGADLASILNSSEVNFIYQETSLLGNYNFWIGLYRNKTTSDPKEGWIWSDGSNFTDARWLYGEPNNYLKNENCADLNAKSKGWNDNDCAKLFSSICKRRKGLPDPTVPTAGPLPPTKDPPPRCDVGWVAFNRSCYRMFSNWKNWDRAKSVCRDTGGHLVRIDNDNEQHFLAELVRPTRHNYWIGLHFNSAGQWVWEFRSNDSLKYKNWQSGEPNSLGKERCVEMYGHAQAGYWNDASCYGWKSYICEKEEGQNMCPEGWIPYNDTCYQFNMRPSQKMTWTEAEAACNAIGNFASLVQINSQNEQDFISKRLQLVSSEDVWIGLNDLKNENVFRWTATNAELDSIRFASWANGKPIENAENRDCVVMLGIRKDGAWSVQDCALKRNFICMRHRDLPFCNGPLGMENGKISDSQITASSFSPGNEPARARFRHSGAWCPAKANKNEYLQIELPFLADIKKIVTEGNVSTYLLRESKDGKTFKDFKPYGHTKEVRPTKDGDYYYFAPTKAFIAKVIRIFPSSWNSYPCLRLEFVGCRAQAPTSTECEGNNWQKGPGKLCFQINSDYKTWEEARSTCLERGGDLLTITNEKEKEAVADQIKNSFHDYYWISLNDRDYRDIYDWSNGDANGLINWGTGAPDNSGKINRKACVRMKRTGLYWKDEDCSNRRPYICMKGVQYTPANFVDYSPTGVWVSSAKYYWPLSAVENNMILGTTIGKVNGKVIPTTGVREKANTALQFTGEGSYIDLGRFDKECFGDPKYCGFGLSLSFMAWFDTSVMSWTKQVNILGSSGDENTSNKGISVYILNKNLWFVLSRTAESKKVSVPLVDNEWRHYVMKWNNSLGLRVSVNGKDIPSTTYTGKGIDTPVQNFTIGFQQGSGFKSGTIKIASVAFWDVILPNDDISSIYKTEFGACPFGWFGFGKSCYQINKDMKSVYYASRECKNAGGDLMNIDTNVEQAFILTKKDVADSWFGVHDQTKESIFVGSNGKRLSFSNWHPGEPNNARGYEDCTYLQEGGSWSDASCYYRKKYICEKEKDVNLKPTNSTATATPVTSITKTALACHYTRITIGCPSDLVIKVNSAFWGRREKSKCTFISVKSCGEDVTNNLKKKCDHYENCKLHASETESYLNTICPSVHKYLEVNFTCVNDAVKKTCKSGWTEFKANYGRCYRLFDTPKTWSDARATCKKAGAELLSISQSSEQPFATSLMERAWYSRVWIGLNEKTKGVYEWSDGSSVSWTNWYVGQPDERGTDKSCVYMSLIRGKRGWMYWKDSNCTRKYPFMCGYFIVPTQKPSAVPTVFDGNCDAGWVTDRSLAYCYHYKPGISRPNWLNAQDACRTDGANLVSIQSKEENEFVRKLSKNAMWLGLEAKGVFRGHVWSDGQPVRYTNWSVGQPDSYNGLEACVEMNPDTGVWSDRDCNEHKNVICKKAKGLTPVTATPVTYPTPGSSLCKKGWTLFQGMCYIKGNDSSNEYLTWQDAEKNCRRLGGNNCHLASVNSQEEQDFLSFLIKGSKSRDFWIGLNDLGTEAEYKWTDGSLYNYANWNSKEPNDFNRQEDCVHLIPDGKWNDHHCQLKLSFVCKTYNESYKPPVKPTALPKPQHDGYCPEGWIAHAKYCYQFHTDPSEYRTWDDARDACEQGHNSSSFGELASIHDEFEQSFITINVKTSTQPLWIGLNNKHLNRYLWVDNTAFNYVKWNTGEPPSWGWNRCAEFVPYPSAAGRWISVYCSQTNGYICKKAASDTPLTPTPTVKASNCANGYESYEESCFKFVKTPKNFDDARDICQNDKGDLMVVDDQFKQAYLIYTLERYIGNIWIGFHRQPYSQFKFVDNSLTAHTYWGPGQPSRQQDQRSCVQANVTGSNFGAWDDMDCGIANPFICEIYKGEPKVTIPLNGSCQDGWRFYNKHCYKHFTTRRSWGAAQYDCSKYGADLVSIHDDREQDFLMYYYQDRSQFSLWTGLNDRDVERGYRWVDNSPVDYINWEDGEPNDYNGRENCVEMKSKSGRWNDLYCTNNLEYMCKKNIECSSAISLDTSMVTVTDTYDATSMGAEQAILKDEKDQYTSWCTNNTSGTAKIMIDLNQLTRLTGITVMGRSNQFVKSFRIDYERDENWRIFYPNRNFQSAIQLYSGLPSTKKFRYPFTADGLSITPITWTGDLICMKIRLYGCAYVCRRQLFAPFPTRIKNDVISASSAKYPINEPKQTGTLGHSWCAEKNDKNQWIQFTFDKENVISVIRTFGDRKKSYVTKYSIQFSEDGTIWTDYMENGVKRIFQGNNNANSPKKHTLAYPIETSYVRIIPSSWNENICMRIALLGCEADCSNPLLSTDKVSKPRYLSSDENSNPEYALFNSGNAWCTDKTPLKEQYLEIRLGVRYRLSKIGTLPSPGDNNEGGQITAFTMKYKKGKNWFVHGPKGVEKVMIAINQNDKSKPMFNALTDYERNQNGLSTKGIRIYPESYTGTRICIRVELYGCLAGAEIIPTTRPTEQKVDISFRITSIDWNDKMSDSKSKEFAETSEKIIKAVETVYSESESFRSAKVLKLTKGSVVAVIELTFNPEFDDDDNGTLNLKAAVESGKVGSLKVDKESYKKLGGNIQASTGDDSGSLSRGAVAGIVITVLVLLALAAGVAFLFYRRRHPKNDFAPTHFENPMSFSSKAYDINE